MVFAGDPIDRGNAMKAQCQPPFHDGILPSWANLQTVEPGMRRISAASSTMRISFNAF
jgi:hypothetical protein